MKVKKYILTVSIFLICILWVGCGKKEKVDKVDKIKNDEPEIVKNYDDYKVDYLKFEIEDNEEIRPIACIEGFYYYEKITNGDIVASQLCVMNIYNPNDKITIAEHSEKGTFDDYIAVCENDDGSYGTIVKEYCNFSEIEDPVYSEMTESGEDLSPSYLISYRKYDAIGQCVDTTTVADNYGNTSVVDAVTSNGIIYLVTDGGYDENGRFFDRNMLSVIDGATGSTYNAPLTNISQISHITATGNGEVVLFVQDLKHNSKVVRWDEESGELMDVLTDNEFEGLRNLEVAELGTAEGDNIYLAIDSVLYLCDIKNATREKVLDIYDYNLYGGKIGGIYRLEDGKIGWSVRTGYYEAETDSIYTANFEYWFDIISPCVKAEEPQKEQIVLACLERTEKLVCIVTDFNINNSDKEIIIKPYYDPKNYTYEDDTDGFTESLHNFIADIESGEGYDLVEMSYIGDFSAMDCFENIYPYIEKDADFSKADFNEKVLKACENSEGNLVFLPAKFGIEGICSKDEILNGESLTLDKFKEISDGKSEDKIIINETPDSILEKAYIAGESYLVDKKNKTSNFTSGGFAKALEVAGAVPSNEYYSEMSINLSPEEMAYNGDLLFYEESINSSYSYEKMLALLGNGFEISGFPANDNSPLAIRVDETEFAINKNSDYKDDCFGFIKRAYNNNLVIVNFSAIETNSGIPTDNNLAKETIDGWVTGESKYSYVFSYGNKEMISDGVSEEQAEDIKALINREMVLKDYYDRDIFMIVTEEAKAFFEGSKTADEVCESIDGKVSIYLNERY